MHTHRLTGPIWSLFRIVIGLLFTLHGAATVLGLFGGNQGTGKAIPMGTWPSWWAGLIQLVCGALVLIGLFTRPAAVLASGSMAYAYFVIHQPHGLYPAQNGGDAPALFCWSFLAIAVLGAGPWSLDAMWRRATESRRAARPVATAAEVAAPTSAVSPAAARATGTVAEPTAHVKTESATA
jgi:putative oxidoreductase